MWNKIKALFRRWQTPNPQSWNFDIPVTKSPKQVETKFILEMVETGSVENIIEALETGVIKFENKAGYRVKSIGGLFEYEHDIYNYGNVQGSYIGDSSVYPRYNISYKDAGRLNGAIIKAALNQKITFEEE